MKLTQSDDVKGFFKTFIGRLNTNEKVFTEDALSEFPFLHDIVAAANEAAISGKTTRLINSLASSMALLTAEQELSIESLINKMKGPTPIKTTIEPLPTLEPLPCVKKLPIEFRHQIVATVKNIYRV